MEYRTLTQNRDLHKLLGQARLTNEKPALVLEFTAGRTSSSADMSVEECQQLLDHLADKLRAPVPTLDEQEKAEKQRRKIISLAHEMRWQVSGTVRADMERINAWCVKYGYLKKRLNDYTAAELVKLVTQFRAVHRTFMEELNQAGNK